jgi:hypothetical protein
MTNRQAFELREKWKQCVDHQPCQHQNQAVERGQDGIVSATYYCCTCGTVVLRIYK